MPKGKAVLLRLGGGRSTAWLGDADPWGQASAPYRKNQINREPLTPGKSPW